MESDELSFPLYRRRPTVDQPTWESVEKPSIRSRGAATPDPFSSQAQTEFVQDERPLNPQQLSEKKFIKTGNQVYYRKKEVQGKVIGVQVKDRYQAIGLKTTSQYLSEGFRTAAIELRNMQADLSLLKRMTAKQEFEQTSYFL